MCIPFQLFCSDFLLFSTRDVLVFAYLLFNSLVALAVMRDYDVPKITLYKDDVRQMMLNVKFFMSSELQRHVPSYILHSLCSYIKRPVNVNIQCLEVQESPFPRENSWISWVPEVWWLLSSWNFRIKPGILHKCGCILLKSGTFQAFMNPRMKSALLHLQNTRWKPFAMLSTMSCLKNNGEREENPVMTG